MAWGGRRPGAGRKPRPTNTPKPIERPALKAEPKLAPAEPKARTDLAAIDPQVWASFLPQLEEISRRYAVNKARSETNSPFRIPAFPPAAVPKDEANRLAMDSAMSWANSEWLAGEVISGLPAEGMLFLGYPYLSELAQRPEYRVMSETIADDATRKWIDFDVVGDKKKEAEERARDPQGYDERMADPDERKKRLKAADKLDKVKALKDDQLRLGLQERLYEQARNDGFFGRSHLFLDIMTTPGAEPSDEELITPIGNGRDATSASKVPKGSFRAIRTIEPVWTYPQMYNAINPLREDWYNPQQWYVMGKQIHVSRLPTFIGHPVPDLLKPAYSFGGLSLTQMAKPYVDTWLQTKQSVGDLIHSFSVMVLMTDLSTLMQPQNANALLARIAMFNMLRDNQGTFVVNKNSEEFKNVSASLAGLHELQAQSQEHMASVHRIPLVKFTGIQPAGLNASSEGEIEVYDDTIGAYQTRFFDPNLRKIIYFEMLSLWGEIDPEITYHWEKLREITQAEKGQKEKDDADRDVKYIDAGVLAPQEVRARIIDDADLPYADLDPDDVPEPPQEEGLDEPGAPDAENDNEPPQPPRKEAGAQDSSDPFGATDEWREEDHPRAENGQFGSGGGASSTGGKSKDFPGIPDFLKRSSTGEKQRLKMPQFGLTPTPWEPHQLSSWKPRKERPPMPASSGDPRSPSGILAFKPGEDLPLRKLNGVGFSKWKAPATDAGWNAVEGQADVGEPPLPDLPKGMTMSTGVVIREPDGRVWIMRPSKGFGGYDQTFPKGGLEDGLNPQANAIKEAWEETGLKVRITGFAGDHEGDTTVSRFYYAEREGGTPKDAGWEAEGVILAPADRLNDFLNRSRDRAIAAALAPPKETPLDPKKLTKLGGKLGSNEGGTFKDEQGNKFYIKRPETKAHVANELAAARLYRLAGVRTLDYRPVEGGNHVATEWAKLDKANIKDFTPAERREAAKDFAVHAWLSNWDAAGTGGDNQGIRNGKPTTLDVGGSLRYRAQGSPKGAAFGPKVSEIDTMRDPSKSYDAAKLFGPMTDDEIKASVERVTSIPDAAIRASVGDDSDLAETLIARKRDLAKRFELQAADEAPFNEADHPRAPDGKFTSSGGGSKVGSAAELKDVLDELFSEPDGENLAEAKSWWDANPELQAEFKEKHPDVVAETPFMQSGTAKPTKFPSLGAKTAEGKQSAFGGLYQTSGATPKENHDLTVKKALEGGGKGGTHFRNMLKQLILDCEKFGTKDKIPALKEKLGWAWGMAAKKAFEKGDANGAAKALKKAAEFGFNSQKIKETVGMAGEPAPPPAPVAKPPAPSKVPPKIAPPTAEELKKAAKNVPLQMAYVPGPKPEIAGGQPMQSANNLIAEFNAKWANKGNLSQQNLVDKVNDFKALQTQMLTLSKIEKFHQSEITAKAKAAQAEQAKKLAEKAAAEAKANAEKNKELMDELGIGQDQAEGLHALAKMLGQSNADLVLAFKSYEAKAKSFGYPISGIEAATIMSYSDGSYGKVNEALRSGAWTPAQHVYVSMVNKALSKMPKHTGSEAEGTHLIRNTHLTAEQIASYAEGHIVQEKALMSTSTKKPNGVFSGNVRFVITSKGKRGASIKKLSHYGSEDEVIFAAKTFFKVNKVEKLASKLSTGADTVIHLEEWEDL